MKLVISFLFLFQMNAALAAPADITKIINLASQIQIAAQNTKASDVQLKNIIQSLQTHLNTLNTATSPTMPGTGECFNFAYAKYYVQFSSADATNKAAAACKRIADLDVAKFFYEKYYVQQSASAAMDSAAQHSDSSVADKLDMIRFAYDKYYVQQSASDASNSAYNAIAPVSAGNMSCLQTLYPNYYQTMSARDAMNATAAACAE